ncbi:MAG TPA: hypothetical protein VEQ59_13460 [Polyangiaceae bacterium]|nr:hypothetical protein [Polyangiaceae bacterium]
MSESRDEALREAYQSPRATGDTAPPPDNVLHYFPEAELQRSSVGAVYGLLSPLFAFAAVAAVTDSAAGGALAAVAVGGWFFWRRKRKKSVPRATFTINGTSLALSGQAFGAPLSLELEQLLDVYLDTETIRRVRENTGSAVPDLRFIDATVGDAQDVARIGLELQRDTLFLTKDRVSHLDASEWSNKIRRFLRRHGWLPVDERASPAKTP